MIVSEWLKQSQACLQDAGISTARLDALVLLEDATGKDRGWLLAHPEFELTTEIVTSLDARLNRRAQHIPLAYIRGKAEFYGREFAVNEHTLVPRPETETMIDMAKRISRLESDITSWEDGGRRHDAHRHRHQGKTAPASSLVHSDKGYKLVWEKPARRQNKPRAPHPEHLSPNDQNLCLIDIGTGSGAIAITAKLELPEATVIATDIDEKCLETAHANARKLGADVQFLQGNLAEPAAIEPAPLVSVLLCNLPYVPDNFQINTAATHEPRHALFGGADGLDLYRELFGQLQAGANKPHYILCESLPPQHDAVATIAKATGFTLRETDDFIQLFEPAV